MIEVKPLILNISPIGFHHYASDFLRAAQAIEANEGFSPVPYYLLCRSIELVLKAYLLAKGVSREELKNTKRLGHDLEKLLDRASSSDLGKIVLIPPEHEQELRKANSYYASKSFEYF